MYFSNALTEVFSRLENWKLYANRSMAVWFIGERCSYRMGFVWWNSLKWLKCVPPYRVIHCRLRISSLDCNSWMLSGFIRVSERGIWQQFYNLIFWDFGIDLDSWNVGLAYYFYGLHGKVVYNRLLNVSSMIDSVQERRNKDFSLIPQRRSGEIHNLSGVLGQLIVI